MEKITQEVNINVNGQMIFAQSLIPLLNNAEKPFIINTTSGLGAFHQKRWTALIANLIMEMKRAKIEKGINSL